jgi:hypothetical protein
MPNPAKPKTQRKAAKRGETGGSRSAKKINSKPRTDITVGCTNAEFLFQVKRLAERNGLRVVDMNDKDELQSVEGWANAPSGEAYLIYRGL